jgi:hypothetical protein
MQDKLQKNGFVNPFEISDNDVVSPLIVPSDSADSQFENFHTQ